MNKEKRLARTIEKLDPNSYLPEFKKIISEMSESINNYEKIELFKRALFELDQQKKIEKEENDESLWSEWKAKVEKTDQYIKKISEFDSIMKEWMKEWMTQISENKEKDKIFEIIMSSVGDTFNNSDFDMKIQKEYKKKAYIVELINELNKKGEDK